MFKFNNLVYIYYIFKYNNNIFKYNNIVYI